MSLWVCLACTAAYAVGLARCPHCGASDHIEQGQEQHMPKTTVHGGASHEHDIPAATSLPPAVDTPSAATTSISPTTSHNAPTETGAARKRRTESR